MLSSEGKILIKIPWESKR